MLHLVSLVSRIEKRSNMSSNPNILFYNYDDAQNFADVAIFPAAGPY